MSSFELESSLHFQTYVDYRESNLTIVSLLALSKESSVPFAKRNFCSTSLTNVALVFSVFCLFMPTIIMIFSLLSIGKLKII